MEGKPKNQKEKLPNVEQVLRLLMRELEDIPEPVSESAARNFLLLARRHDLHQAIRDANNYGDFGLALNFIGHRIKELEAMEAKGDFTAGDKRRLEELKTAQKSLFN